MQDKELKPCPFCRGEAEFSTTGLYSVRSSYVRCVKCGAVTLEVAASIDYCAQDKAAEAWNRRAEPSK